MVTENGAITTVHPGAASEGAASTAVTSDGATTTTTTPIPATEGTRQPPPTVPAVATTTTTNEAEKPVSRAELARLIAEATAQAVAQGKSLGRSELQAQQDRKEARERHYRESIEQRLKQVDPDGYKDTRLERYEEDERNQGVEAENAKSYQAWKLHQQRTAKAAGLDPADPTLDYAQDAPNVLVATERFAASLEKRAEARRALDTQEAAKRQAEYEASLEKRLRAKLGLDSVDTSEGAGGMSGDDAVFMRDWASGTAKPTKANIERARKLTFE